MNVAGVDHRHALGDGKGHRLGTGVIRDGIRVVGHPADHDMQNKRAATGVVHVNFLHFIDLEPAVVRHHLWDIQLGQAALEFTGVDVVRGNTRPSHRDVAAPNSGECL